MGSKALRTCFPRSAAILPRRFIANRRPTEQVRSIHFQPRFVRHRKSRIEKLGLLALTLYPLVRILTLPFRLVGIAVEGVFDLLGAIITLPARILSGPRRA